MNIFTTKEWKEYAQTIGGQGGKSRSAAKLRAAKANILKAQAKRRLAFESKAKRDSHTAKSEAGSKS